MGQKREKRSRLRPTLKERFEKEFEIDADMMSGGGRVEIRGRTRVEVGGVKKIRSYSDTCVELLMDRGVLFINGRRLECVFYQRDAAAVEGLIDSVGFGE